MNWVVRVSDDARLFINQLPLKVRRQVNRSIGQMEQDPFRGDVLPLQGPEWKGYYRKRAGDYRIVFFPHRQQRTVDVGWVLLRKERTYR